MDKRLNKRYKYKSSGSSGDKYVKIIVSKIEPLKTELEVNDFWFQIKND